MPRNNAALENMKTHHQTSMVEIKGILKDKSVSILNNTCASLSYISPRILELCKLQQNKFEKSGLVQFSTGTKQKSN